MKGERARQSLGTEPENSEKGGKRGTREAKGKERHTRLEKASKICSGVVRGARQRKNKVVDGTRERPSRRGVRAHAQRMTVSKRPVNVEISTETGSYPTETPGRAT